MNHPLHLFSYCPKCGSAHFQEQNSKAKSCLDCGFVYYFNSSAAVAAFIFNPQGELLVCRRAKEPAKGSLDLPGGFVDMHETAEDAVKREIKEELNVEIDSLTYSFSLPNIYTYSGFDVHTLDMFFSCEVSSFQGLCASDDVAEAFFMPLAEIKLEEVGLLSIRKGLEILLNNTLQAKN